MSRPPTDLAWSIRTPRLRLRCWRPEDALLLKDAIDSSLDHLRPWLPWVADEPTPIDGLARRLASFRVRFERRESFVYAIFDPDETRVLGGTGLHLRVGSSAREIGYWIRAGETAQGYATEAAAAMTRVAFEVQRVRLVEIHCDPTNRPSAAVPRKLGYEHAATVAGWTPDAGAVPRDTMIWRLGRRAYPGSAAARQAIEAADESGRMILDGAVDPGPSATGPSPARGAP